MGEAELRQDQLKALFFKLIFKLHPKYLYSKNPNCLFFLRKSETKQIDLSLIGK